MKKYFLSFIYCSLLLNASCLHAQETVDTPLPSNTPSEIHEGDDSALINLEFIDVSALQSTPPNTEWNLHLKISKSLITLRQYCAFLNAVAANDTNGLYHQAQESDKAFINRSGEAGHYQYSLIEEDDLQGDLPVTGITWFDAIRFCNWMQHEQPVGPQDSTTTEDGAYFLPSENDASITMNNDPVYFLPSEAEWNQALV